MQPPEDKQPTRRQALLFWGKAWLFRVCRIAQNLRHGAPRPLRLEAVTSSDLPALAESRAPLYGSSLPAEFALQAGKVQNLRLAARALHGRILPADEVFSFWANVPRSARWRGYAPGRELREGC